MGLFSIMSPLDSDVEKVTCANNTSEDWALIMDICDKVGNSSQNAKECLRSIVKRLNAQDPHIQVQAVTLLDACSNNCGKTFHLEIASREFEAELRKLICKGHPKIAEKLKILLKKWVDGDFKTDPQLNLIPSLYNKLKSEGVDFSHLSEPVKHSTPLSKDPNVVTNSQEEEDIAKAIELSLKESKQHQQISSSYSSPVSKKSSSLYPQVSSSLNSVGQQQEGRKVRALYDFEAAEDNELTFSAGEIIHILDDSDQNWWKGSNHRGEGLFPSNFVTADLSAEPEQLTKLEESRKKSIKFNEEVEVKTVKREPEVIEIEIDEQKIDRLLHLLHEADPQSDHSDPQEMLDLEEQVTAMGPLIDAALEKVDRQHAQLTQSSSDLVDALNLYHTLMREPQATTQSSYNLPKMQQINVNNFSFPTQGPPHAPHMYNRMPMSSQPTYGAAGGPGHFNTNMPSTEYMSGPMSMPHYQMQPGPQHRPTTVPQPQGLSSDRSSIPYQPQGYPGQVLPPGSYIPPGSTDPSLNQQTRFAPSNSQQMM